MAEGVYVISEFLFVPSRSVVKTSPFIAWYIFPFIKSNSISIYNNEEPAVYVNKTVFEFPDKSVVKISAAVLSLLI